MEFVISNLKLGILAGLLTLLACTNKSTSPLEPENTIIERSRPEIAKGTLLTDQGTHLRGVYWSLDWAGKLPRYDVLADVRNFGMNTVHLYAERFDSGLPAGTYSAQVDSMVQWCGELGLYLVLTIGGGNHNGEFDADFAAAFWNHYAPKYQDKTWVIYEIYNEPQAWKAPYSKETLAMEQAVYNLIREHAAETPVLLFSYAEIGTVPNIQQDINQLNVDWANALIAWHGYVSTLTVDILEELKTAGINNMCTELPIGSQYSNQQVNTQNIQICEDANISWLVFIDMDSGLDSWRFKEAISRNGISWEPDYGTWPGSGSTYVPPKNLAENQPVVVSSVENNSQENTDGANAVDGDMETRWSSEFSDPQYIIIDLGNIREFNRILLEWEYASAKEYEIQTSDDNKTWKTLAHITNGDGGLDLVSVSGTGRYVRLYCLQRSTVYGYSLYEIEIAYRQLAMEFAASIQK